MLDECYAVRFIGVADSDTVALHRSLMFRDMGLLDECETVQLHKASRPWIEEQLQNGTYVGWFVQCNDVVVAGCGLHLSTFGPKPGFSEGGKSAHVANVYVETSHRRRGLADELMATALQWARTQYIREMTLSLQSKRGPFMSVWASHATQLDMY